MLDALSLAFFQRALIAGVLASAACGIVGAYVVVKRIASISGGMSHAAFGGVGLGYLLKFDPLFGAALFALGCGTGVGAIPRAQRRDLDTLIAMMWSVGMALGIVFVALAPGYAPDLMSYLFGNILFVPARFLWIVAALDVLVLTAAVLLYRPLLNVTFDEEFAELRGLPVRLLFQILLALTALTVVVLIRVVGVILVIALLTMPAATARQWARDLRPMMIGAGVLGGACTIAGLFASYTLADLYGVNLPTGPLIILVAAFAYGISAIARLALSTRMRGAADAPATGTAEDSGPLQ